ncbi:MAG: lysophospholipid acyltransferase family protein [Candidatus Omnitrophota bacterium]
MIYIISRFFCWLVLKVFFGLKVKGAENIPRRGGFILAVNHVSYLDPAVAGVACSRLDLNYMAKKDLFSNPFMCWYMGKIQAFAVKRGTGDISAFKESFRRVKRGEGLLIFPEGTRQETGVLGKAEPGVGFLAAKLKVPVIPVYIKGTETILPKHAQRLRFNPIYVCIGPQVKIENYTNYEIVAENIMLGIKEAKNHV